MFFSEDYAENAFLRMRDAKLDALRKAQFADYTFLVLDPEKNNAEVSLKFFKQI